MHVVSASISTFLGVSSRVLSEFLNLRATEEVSVELFSTNPLRCCDCRGDDIESMRIEAAPEILVSSFSGDKLISTAKFFTLSCEMQRDLLAVAITKEVKQEAWQLVFPATYKKALR